MEYNLHPAVGTGTSFYVTIKHEQENQVIAVGFLIPLSLIAKANYLLI